MKSYPSIDHSGRMAQGQKCDVFVKYDGSNLRFEWSKKRGWYKFGTRKVLFDASTPIYGSSVDLFLQKYGDSLAKVFQTKYKQTESAIVFCEWFGARSFAGMHKPDDEKALVLFDVNIYKKGILGPQEFLGEFGHLEIAEYLGQATLDDDFIQAVRSSKFGCSSKFAIRNEFPEGVICKGGERHKLWMAKIKTQNYYDQLKKVFPEDWTKYWE